MIKPRAGAFPFARNGSAGDRQRVCNLLLRQAAEVSELHDATLARVERPQLVQRFVEHQDVAAGGLRRGNLVVEVHRNRSAVTFAARCSRAWSTRMRRIICAATA